MIVIIILGILNLLPKLKENMKRKYLRDDESILIIGSPRIDTDGKGMSR